ncbi:MAG: hypothetical protein PHT94_03435 [Candidatus Nanoarchaeia archaeon]|nr:hypothetical protein [Candidatus Nanoarchaeia archaeon]
MKSNYNKILSNFVFLLIIIFTISFSYSYIEITNCVGLQNMQNNLNEDYVLMNDINCSDTINWNSGEGFISIGSNTNNFLGSFDGKGYTISNLFINITDNKELMIGLFGYFNGANLKNVTIKDSFFFVNSTNNNNAYIGALSGYFRGQASDIFVENIEIKAYATKKMTIGGAFGNTRDTLINNVKGENVVISGRNYNSDDSDYTNIGGIIGEGGNLNNSYLINGSINYEANRPIDLGGIIGQLVTSVLNNSFVRNSKLNGTSYSSTSYVGGVIGYSSSSSYSENIFSENNLLYSSALAGLKDAYTGGVVGRGDYMSNSYSKNDSINAYSFTDNYCTIGGIAGVLNYQLSNSYSIIGILEALSSNLDEGRIGSLIGESSSGSTLNNLYSNSNLSSESLIYSDSSSTKNNINYLTTEQMKEELNFIGFSFVDFWDINTSINEGYPFLSNLLYSQTILDPDPDPEPEIDPIYLDNYQSYYFGKYDYSFINDFKTSNIKGFLDNAINSSISIIGKFEDYLTISFLIKLNNTENQNIMQSNNLLFDIEDNQFKITINSNSLSVPIDLSWTHLTIEFSEKLKIYKNGILLNESLLSQKLNTSNMYFNLSGSLFDELKIYRAAFLDNEKIFRDLIEDYAMEKFVYYKQVDLNVDDLHDFLIEINESSMNGFFFEKHGSKYYQLPSCEFQNKTYVKVFNPYNNEYNTELVDDEIYRYVNNESKIYYFYNGGYVVDERFNSKKCIDVFGNDNIILEDYDIINDNIVFEDEYYTQTYSDKNIFFDLEKLNNNYIQNQNFYFQKSTNCDYYFNGEIILNNYLQKELFLENNFLDIICKNGYKVFNFFEYNSNVNFVKYYYKTDSLENFKVFIYTNESVILDKEKIKILLNNSNIEYSYVSFGNLHMFQFFNFVPGDYELAMIYDNDLVINNSISFKELTLGLIYSTDLEAESVRDNEYIVESDTSIFFNSDYLSNEGSYLYMNSNENIRLGFESELNSRNTNVKKTSLFVKGYGFVHDVEIYQFPFYVQYIGFDQDKYYFSISNSKTNYYVIG